MSRSPASDRLETGIVGVGAVAFLAITIGCLGVASHLRKGEYHPAAIVLLLIAFVAAVAALAVNRRRWTWAWGGCLVFASLIAVLAVDFWRLQKFDLISRWTWGQNAVGFMFLAAVAGMWQNKRWQWGCIAGLAIASFVCSCDMLRDFPRLEGDVLMFHQGSTEALWRGINPYAIRYPNLYPRDTAFYGPGVVDADNYLTISFPYPPFSLLMSMPGYLLGGDVRYSTAAAIAISAVLMALARQSRQSILAAAALLMCANLPFVVLCAYTEPLVVLTLSLAMFAACRWPKAFPYCFGLFLASKQYCFIACPLAWLLADGTGAQRWRAAVVILIKAIVIAVIVTLPLALWDLRLFTRSVIVTQMIQPFRDDAISFPAAWVRLFGGRPIAWLGFAVLAPAWILTLRFCRPSPAGLATGIALVFLSFFAFNKQAFGNYYVLVIGAACWAIAATDLAWRDTRVIDSGEAGDNALGTRQGTGVSAIADESRATIPMQSAPSPAELSEWKMALLALLAACFIGQAIYIDLGMYTRRGIALLFPALASLVLAIVIGRPRPGHSQAQPSGRLALPRMAMGPVIGSGLMLIFFGVIGHDDWRAIPFAIVALTPFIAIVRRGWVRTACLAIIASVFVFQAVTFMHDKPYPHIDVLTFQQRAAEALQHGCNPYQVRYLNVYGPDTPYYGKGVIGPDGYLTYSFPYPPLSLLLVMPGQLILHDVRYATVALAALSAVLMVASRFKRHSVLVAAAFLLTPCVLDIIRAGWTEPLVVFTFSLAMICACRRPRLLPYALGLFFACKQYTILTAPAVWLLAEGAGRDRWKHWLQIMIKALIVALVVTLPLAAWDFRPFFRSTVLWQLVQPFRDDALSFLVLWFNVFGRRPPMWIAVVVLVPAWVLALRRAPRSPSGFAAAAMIILFAFFAFNKQAFVNYYYFVIAAACWTAAAARIDQGVSELKPSVT
jgi:hypothetical protein